jgi:hypothetical protein
MRVDGKFMVGEEIPDGQGRVTQLLEECFELAYDLRTDAADNSSASLNPHLIDHPFPSSLRYGYGHHVILFEPRTRCFRMHQANLHDFLQRYHSVPLALVLITAQANTAVSF